MIYPVLFFRISVLEKRGGGPLRVPKLGDKERQREPAEGGEEAQGWLHAGRRLGGCR